jgi:hypothetical protein
MSQEVPRSPLRLCLSGRDGLGRVYVDSDAFFDFSFWMAEELQDLLATQQHRWGHHRPKPAKTSGRSAHVTGPWPGR